MEKRAKQNLLVLIIGICLFVALMNLTSVLKFAGKLVELVLPVIVGGILALFINVPMNWVEKRLNKLVTKAKKPPSSKWLHIFSFILTVCLVLLVVIAVLTLVIPELVRSSISLYSQIEANIPGWLAFLETHNINAHWLEEQLSNVDVRQMIQHITQSVDALLPNIFNALTSTINGFVTAGFALVVSIYMTLGKEQVCRHGRKIVCAYLSPSWSKRILHFCHTFQKSFANFLTGQCAEAMILGILMFLAFTIFRLPYASLVGVLTAVCAIIPYVGAFISCVVSAFLTVIFNPALVLRCLIVYLAVQFFENQFLYPRVVGDSVGLPPLYTLVAAMIGGKLFGIIGILFFIPLMAVTIELVREDVKGRLTAKGNCSNSASSI